MKISQNRFFGLKKYGAYSVIILIFLIILMFPASSAQAVVWCHDFVIYSLTGQNIDKAPPETLRALLTNLGYKPFNYTMARSLPEALSHLQPGDVLVIGDSHSGVVNLNGTIDHFIQIEGTSGTHYDPQEASFQTLVRRNNTLEEFLNRPIYQKLPLEIWRFIKKAEFSAAGYELPLISQGVWISNDMSVNPQSGSFIATFINREFNRIIGNKAVLNMQGTIDPKTLKLTAGFSGSLKFMVDANARRENRFAGSLNLPFSRSGTLAFYKGPANLTFSQSTVFTKDSNKSAPKPGYEVGKKYTGPVVLNLLDAGLLPQSIAAETAPLSESPKSYLSVFVVTSDGKELYGVDIEISSKNYSTYGSTDPDGQSRFSLPGGTYIVNAQPPKDKSYKPASRTVTVQARQSVDVCLVLRSETEPVDQADFGQLTVRVMDEAGWFKGAAIIIGGLDPHNNYKMVQTTTGADGYAATIEALPPGYYAVIASAAGHGTDGEHMNVTAGKEASLVLLLPYKTQPLSVAVFDKISRKIIQGARVEIDLGATTLTNAQGVAAFKAVPVGQRKGKATAAGYQDASFSVAIEEDIDYLTSTIVYLEPGKPAAPMEAAASLTDRERQALRDDLERWEKILECLEEGKRKYPNYWQDCNGNWTMRDREVEIAHYRDLINRARAKLGQAPIATQAPAVTTPASIPADRVALINLSGNEAFGTAAGTAERRPQSGELLSSGSSLRTGKQSTAAFQTAGGTKVTLQENSRVQVTHKPKDSGSVWQVEASSGTIDVEHHETAPSFDDVITTSRDGTITPLNTHYRVEVGPAGTTVDVFKGRVRLTGNQILRLNTEGKPSPAQTMDLRAGERAIMLKTAAASIEKPIAKNLLINGGFEQGLASPWESGFYTKKPVVWMNSGDCKSTADLDQKNFHSGTASLYLRNQSNRAPNIYGTMAQKIKVIKNRYYAITLWARGQNLASNGALNIAVDPMWRIRPIALPAGNFDWTRFYKTINSGDRDSIEFRIIFEDTGDVWLDDIMVEELPENYKE
jgi:ferric-dicitrate binding protein FerR (iron transport regulator)